MQEISIQTLNLGLLQIFGKDIVEYVDKRFELLLEKLPTQNPDVFCFQELYEKKHFEAFREVLKKYPYQFFSKSKNILFPPGLCIFSKFPILDSTFFRFHDQQDIEKLSNHGFAVSQIQIGDRILNFVNCHLTSGGLTGNTETDINLKTTFKQIDQICEEISRKEVAILVGDFNFGMINGQKKYEYLESFGFHNGYQIQGAEVKKTWDKENHLVKLQRLDFFSENIDHLFLSNNSTLKVISAELNFAEQLPFAPYHFSDHYGLLFKIMV